MKDVPDFVCSVGSSPEIALDPLYPTAAATPYVVSTHEGQELRVYTVKASGQGNQEGEFHADSDGDPGASRVSSSAKQAVQRDDSIHDHVDDSAYRKTAGAEMLRANAHAQCSVPTRN